MTTLSRAHVFADNDPVYASEINAEYNNILKALRLRVAHLDGTRGYSVYPSVPASDPTDPNEPNRKVRVDLQLELAELSGRQNVINGFGTTYEDFGNQKVFSKVRADTDIVIMVYATGFVNTVGALATLGFRLATTDYDVATKGYNRASVHMAMGGVRVVTGLAAGSLSARARAKVNTGLWSTDANDMLHWWIKEVYSDTTA